MKAIATAIVAAVLAAGLAASSAQAQGGPLGWVMQLSGSCWQGVGANGAQVDRQCFQTQFGRFLRTSVTRPDGFSGASVLGWNTARHRLEMYAWGSADTPAIYAPAYDGAVLAFAQTEGRVIWRRGDQDTFQIVTQQRTGNAWTDNAVITYHRDGAAPAAFEAIGGNSMAGASGGMGWLDAQAGHCFHQVEPQVIASNHGCLSWEYAHVLRQTWYWGSTSPTGETVMFRDGANIRSFAWDAQGNFGVGGGGWLGETFVSSNDAVSDRRTSLRPAARGFSTTTEVRDRNSGGAWVVDHSIRLRND